MSAETHGAGSASWLAHGAVGRWPQFPPRRPFTEQHTLVAGFLVINDSSESSRFVGATALSVNISLALKTLVGCYDPCSSARAIAGFGSQLLLRNKADPGRSAPVWLP